MACSLAIFFSVIVVAAISSQSVESLSFLKRQNEDQPVAKRTRLDIQVCSAGLEQCLLIRRSITYDKAVNNNDVTCARLRRFISCMESIVQPCRFPPVTDDVVPAGIGFLCSESGKSLVRQYERNSSCYNNVNKIGELGISILRCAYGESALGFRELRPPDCAHINLLKDCSTNETTSECGEAAGRLIAGYYEDVIRRDYARCRRLSS